MAAQAGRATHVAAPGFRYARRDRNAQPGCGNRALRRATQPTGLPEREGEAPWEGEAPAEPPPAPFASHLLPSRIGYCPSGDGGDDNPDGGDDNPDGGDDNPDGEDAVPPDGGDDVPPDGGDAVPPDGGDDNPDGGDDVPPERYLPSVISAAMVLASLMRPSRTISAIAASGTRVTSIRSSSSGRGSPDERPSAT